MTDMIFAVIQSFYDAVEVILWRILCYIINYERADICCAAVLFRTYKYKEMPGYICEQYLQAIKFLFYNRHRSDGQNTGVLCDGILCHILFEHNVYVYRSEYFATVQHGDGIVYLTGLFLLTPLTHLKLDLINFGTIKILCMILEHSCREPEVVVKCCVRNFSNLVYCKVISRSGHRGFDLRS